MSGRLFAMEETLEDLLNQESALKAEIAGRRKMVLLSFLNHQLQDAHDFAVQLFKAEAVLHTIRAKIANKRAAAFKGAQ